MQQLSEKMREIYIFFNKKTIWKITRKIGMNVLGSAILRFFLSNILSNKRFFVWSWFSNSEKKLPLQYVESVWFKGLILHLCLWVVFNFDSSIESSLIKLYIYLQ
jgi:hypothetical protein